MRQTQGRGLVNIRSRDPKPGTVTDMCFDLRMRLTHDDTDIADARLRDRTEAELKDRSIANGHQLFGAGVSYRSQTGPSPA